jgi:hypothetical protein
MFMLMSHYRSRNYSGEVLMQEAPPWSGSDHTART